MSRMMAYSPSFGGEPLDVDMVSSWTVQSMAGGVAGGASAIDGGVEGLWPEGLARGSSESGRGSRLQYCQCQPAHSCRIFVTMGSEIIEKRLRFSPS